MTWLLFIDESGHDHKATPLEVRGGVAIHVSKLWGFIQAWQRLELDCFGARLVDYGKESKGYKLLDKDRFRWAGQAKPMIAEDRRKAVRTFLHKGLEKSSPSSVEFAAYGQASLEMARGAFDILTNLEAKLFGCAIPRGTKQPAGYALADYLRKDHVFLFERFFYFLEAKKEHGLIVMDETDKKLDKQFVRRMESYFTRTATGRNRSHWIVPAPLFVSSDMTYAVQAADICLYAINWGYRPTKEWSDLEQRPEIASEFGPKLTRFAVGRARLSRRERVPVDWDRASPGPIRTALQGRAHMKKEAMHLSISIRDLARSEPPRNILEHRLLKSNETCQVGLDIGANPHNTLKYNSFYVRSFTLIASFECPVAATEAYFAGVICRCSYNRAVI